MFFCRNKSTTNPSANDASAAAMTSTKIVNACPAKFPLYAPKAIRLMMSAGDAPLFLQFKEAVESVLEPYTKAFTSIMGSVS